MVDLHTGWRRVEVTAQRTSLDDAHQLQWLVNEAYPDVAVIRLVQDNLNTHRLANLYLVFPLEEAQHIAKQFEIYYTSKHGSLLTMVEMEIGIF